MIARSRGGDVWPNTGDIRERGETLVEFALALTIFLMTLLGTAEFGLMVWQYNMLSDLAQEGARRAAVCGTGRALSTSECNVQSFVQSRSLGLNPTVTTFSVDMSTKACTTTVTNPAILASGSGVCVTVEKSFAPLTRIVPLATLTLQSTAQMIMSR
jgi:Flp pilus assembly protein TadG